MSYHVLARKWRPQTFSDVVGQSHVVKALRFALDHQQIHHAYLLTGTRGVGKTSIARIFAKALNCETNGVSANPCGTCTTCREIASGKFVDLLEVDAASRTGVDETRELIESIAYLPTKGRYKVYLIDEVHMFSKSSFNALLKTLEEPPEYVKFILATTDHDKLPTTILSRCLQLNLKSLTKTQIARHLAKICQSEAIAFDEQALTMLARAGQGSMRDTLSITDQAIAYGQGKLTTASVTELLGTVHIADIEAILFAIATNNPNQLDEALKRLHHYDIDASAFLIEIMHRLQQMAWAKEGIAEDLSSNLASTVAEIPKPLIHLWYDIAHKALPTLSLGGDECKVVEMTLLRMLAFTPTDWIARHRTPLARQTNITTPDSEQNPKQEHKTQPPSFINVAKTNDNASANFTKSGYATPIESFDNIEDAEADFANRKVQVPKTTLAAVFSKPEGQQPQGDKHQVVELEKQQENHTTSKQDEAARANAWHPDKETSQQPHPNMDDVYAIMQRGRDIIPATAPSTELTAIQGKNEQQTEAPTTDAADERHVQPGDTATAPDLPPWEIAEEPKEKLMPDTIESAEHPLKQAIGKTTHSSGESVGTANLKQHIEEAVEQPNSDTACAQLISTATRQKLKDFIWFDVFSQLPLSEFSKNSASLGIITVAEPRHQHEAIPATFTFSPRHEPIMTDNALAELKTALKHYFDHDVNLDSQLSDVNQQTPSEQIAQQKAKHQEALLERFSTHPATQQIVTTFGAAVITNSVKACTATNDQTT